MPTEVCPQVVKNPDIQIKDLSSFPLTPKEELHRKNLEPGNRVNLIFHSSECTPESLWVTVEEEIRGGNSNAPCYRGVLENPLFDSCLPMKEGDPIIYSWKNVRMIWWEEGDKWETHDDWMKRVKRPL